MKHLIIVPTYNEAENIEKLVLSIFKLYPSINILIVDDSSPDGTGSLIKNMQSDNSSLYLLSQKSKSGLAKAYINGLKWGINNGFDLFTTLDADFSHKPVYIQDAINLINSGCDIACGSRYIEKAHTTEKNWFRNFISIVGNNYINFILGQQLKDWTGGFNTYTKCAIEKINLDEITVSGYIFQTQIKYKALKSGSIIKEFPIVFEERKQGKSKMSASIILEAFISVLKIKFYKK